MKTNRVVLASLLALLPAACGRGIAILDPREDIADAATDDGSNRQVDPSIADAADARDADDVATDTSAPSPGRTTQCSTGPVRDAGTIPYEQRPFDASTPNCIPRCGAEEKYRYVGLYGYAIDALPSGACDYDGETCTMTGGTTLQCPDKPKRLCNLSHYECRCEGGSWACVIVSQGGGACTPCGALGTPDAEVDGSPPP